MTFQIGLIGTNGILLASDRRQIYSISSTEQNPYAPNQPGEVSKFLWSANCDLICGFAGSPTSRDVARGLAESTSLGSLPNLPLESEVERISNERSQPMGPRDEIMIVRRSDISRIKLLSRWPHVTRLTDITEWITTGDNSGPARFFLHHFYEKRSIAELKRIALLTLTYASLENPSGIGGYEMWAVTSDGIELCPFEQFLAQADKARGEIESVVRKVIFS